MSIAYCTIVAENYLPQAITLYGSVADHEPEVDFHILLIGDVPPTFHLYNQPHLTVIQMHELPLSEKEVSNLAMIYDVVELSTALKPLLLSQLLCEYQKVVYLDPDMFLVTPLIELPSLLDDFSIILTPHILNPIAPGTPHLSEINNLTVGIYNLGFCAVNRRAKDYLDWWWSHLQRECLIYPLLGLFVDQKWVDMGSVIFEAYALKHNGYNIGHWNLHERKFYKIDNCFKMFNNDEPLRLMHFSGFDPENPTAISTRQNESLTGRGLDFEALDELSAEYAGLLIKNRRLLSASNAYVYALDSSHRKINRRLRRTYRSALLRQDSKEIPSAFLPEDRKAFSRWRRRSSIGQVKNLATDLSIALNYAMPDLGRNLRRRFPNLISMVRKKLLTSSNIRR